LFSKSNPLINLEGDALDAIIGMKPNGLVHVAASEILLKLVVALVEISLNTSQRMVLI
jgi:hypothetical protein